MTDSTCAVHSCTTPTLIEADGDYWHSLRPEVDLRKTRELEAMGYMVYRFTETEINGDGFARQIGSVVA